MYGDIPNVTRCCFCVPLRYGLLVWAYIKLIVTIVVLGMILFWIPALMWFLILGPEGLYMIGLFVFKLVVLLFDVIFNIAFIVGLHKKNTTLIRLYWRYGIGYAVTEIIFFLLVVGYLIYGSGSVDHNLLESIVIFSSGITAILILHTYIMILIRSELRKLKGDTQFKFENHAAEPVCVMQPSADIKKTESNKEGEINRNKS